MDGVFGFRIALIVVCLVGRIALRLGSSCNPWPSIERRPEDEIRMTLPTILIFVTLGLRTGYDCPLTWRVEGSRS
jgi:hypothetical protein